MKDISFWYDEDRAIEAEIDWILHQPHAPIVKWLMPRLEPLTSVVEFGCGSGIVAASLPVEDYLGVDANPHFLRMARSRCPHKKFVQEDVRTFRPDRTFGVVMAWNFMKHFGIDDWTDILRLTLSHARFGAFNVQTLEFDLDDGNYYHHSHVTESRLANALREAGHHEVERFVTHEWPVSHRQARNVLLWTEKI